MAYLRRLFIITLFTVSLWLLNACTLIIPQSNEPVLSAQPPSALPTPEIDDESAIRASVSDAWAELMQPSQSYRMTVTVAVSESSEPLVFEVIDREHLYSKVSGPQKSEKYECIQFGADSYVNVGDEWQLAPSVPDSSSPISSAYPCNSMFSFFLVDPYGTAPAGPDVQPIFKSQNIENQTGNPGDYEAYDVYQISQVTGDGDESCTTYVWIDSKSHLLTRTEYVAVTLHCYYPWSFTRMVEYDRSIQVEKPTLD